MQVPHDPVDLAPSNLEAVAIQGGVGLDWDAPEADAESITGYRILRSASPEVVLVEDTKSDVTEFIDDTVNDQGLYTYRIEGLRGNVKSDSSNSRTILFLDNEPVAVLQASAPELLLVKNTNLRDANSAILTQANDKVAQAFTTGTHEGGYRITSIGAVADTIQTISTAGDELTATINQGGSTNPGAVLCTLVNPSFTSSGLQTFTVPADCPTLNPRTDYFFVIERTSGTEHISWESNVHNGEDYGGRGDWSIADGRRHLFSGSWSGDNFSHPIEIRGSLEPPALVKNTSLSGSAELGMGIGAEIAQAFTTGGHTVGYRLTSIGVKTGNIADTAAAGSQLTATLNEGSGTNPGAVLCTFTDPPAFTSSGIQTFTAPAECPTLRAKRTYFFVLSRHSGTTGVVLPTDANDAEDPGRTRDWRIANGNRYVFGGSWTGSGSSALIEVKGAKVVPQNILVKNTDEPVSSGQGLGFASLYVAQEFTTGPNLPGYAISSIGIRFTEIADTAGAASELTVTLNESYIDDLLGEQVGAALCTLDDPSSFVSSVVNIFSANGCPTLKPGTKYLVAIARAQPTGAESTITLQTTSSNSEDSLHGWTIAHRFLLSAVLETWGEEVGDVLMLEISGGRASAPPTQLLWSEEITPSCPPIFGSCGYHGANGGTLTNSQFNHQGATYRVKQLTWWADDNSGYVKLVIGANNEDKNRTAATAGKFSDFDYLRVAWGEPARDDPYHPDFKFGPDETLANPRPGFGTGRYNSVNNDVTFLWKMSKSEYSNRGLKYAGNHYPIYVQLRK